MLIGNNEYHVVSGGDFKLDGGAMFGNAPKALWSRWVDADEQNRIALSCRAMLVQEDGRNILVETGIGAFFAPNLKSRYGVVEDRHVLIDSHDSNSSELMVKRGGRRNGL